jgi:hypothetical protein
MQLCVPCACAEPGQPTHAWSCAVADMPAVLCRLLVAFNTSSGLPVTYVSFKDRAGRAKAGMSDANTNIAEAGTISMEFTSIGRLLGECQIGSCNAVQSFLQMGMAVVLPVKLHAAVAVCSRVRCSVRKH